MKMLLIISLFSSLSAMATVKERYELHLKQSIKPEDFKVQIYIQDGEISKKDHLEEGEIYCSLNVHYNDKLMPKDGPFYFTDLSIISEKNSVLVTMTNDEHDFNVKIGGIECHLKFEENTIKQINQILGNVAELKRSEVIKDEDLKDKTLAGSCEKKVLSYYADIFHKTYKAANNTFLNNFVGRKNMFAHALAYPEIAFKGLLISGENYIAENIIDDSKRTGEEVFFKYMRLLRTGQLCEDLKENYKKPRKVRAYLLEQLKK